MSNQPATPQEQPPEAVPTFDMNNPPYTEEEKAALASKRATAEPAPAAQPQPQPQPISQQPAQPAPGQPQPMQPQPGRPMGPMPPKQGMSKGLLWSLIGGGIGIFVLIIIIIVCIVLFSGPSTEDYRKAYAMMNSFDSTSLNIDRSDPETSINEVVRKADDHFDKLGKAAAMRDGEVKKAFEEYKSDYEKVKPLLKESGAVATAYKEYSNSCRTSYSSPLSSASGDEAGQKYDEQQKSCLNALNKMKDSQYASVRDYANEQIKYRKEMRAYYVALVNYYKNRDSSSSSPKRPEIPSTSLTKSLYDKLKDAQSSSKESVRELRDILRTKGKMDTLGD
jgi:protease 1